MLLPSWSNCLTGSWMNRIIFDSELFKGQVGILLLTRYEYTQFDIFRLSNETIIKRHKSGFLLVLEAYFYLLSSWQR